MQYFPNIIVNGVAKSGTSSMYYYLKDHPDIYMPNRKEMNFFSSYQREKTVDYRSNVPRIKSLEEYLTYYNEGEHYQLRGDVSPSYFRILGTAKEISKHIPNVKFITTLRNPIARAYSGYQMQSRLNSYVPNSDDPFSPDKSWVELGLYYHRVKEYFDQFDRSQILIVLLDDLHKQHSDTLKKVFDHVGADSSKYNYEKNEVFNSGFSPRNRLIHNFARNNRFVNQYITPNVPKPIKAFARKLENLNKTKMAPLEEEDRARLAKFYHDDVRRLEELIDRDLSHWC